ncbi:AAA family ATPase [Phormidium sp. LEGE 05292]|uniref:AAA family ATPase n=1 Tax=[Phormidium] sp. LEGE 05292 TaxID=767427 RepID=UPI0018812E48|nr:AAA family ATPase [Phormidium sp. LEGE 05292]MBE9229569.1 AAA family ATPase [Phormidium sp. LEGE 05292]
MLTRIEINGFKTFENFALDLSPFSVILGPNASGKSNLFDALQFLSQIAVNNLRDAVRGLVSH